MTRRNFLSLMGAASLVPELAEGKEWESLEERAKAPLRVEFPGLSPSVLKPGPAREEYGANVADFPKTGPLTFRQVTRQVDSWILERSIEVLAGKDAVFNLEMPYEFLRADSFYSWRKKEFVPVAVSQDNTKPASDMAHVELFPFAGAVERGRLVGVLSDTPGFWNNRAQQLIDPVQHRLSLRTGDSSSVRTVASIWGDSSHFYRGNVDGWQHIAAGQILRFNTWLFQAHVEDLYDVQLAAHRALAKAKGWDRSAVTAILKNAAYLLIRRNLLRDESRYIIMSGPNYGWKEWVSDAVMAGLGLDNHEILASALEGIFWSRISYEENAQYYLMASALLARDGFRPNAALCRRSLEFIRDHERNGAYMPPSLDGGLGWKTYMDLFYYANGDSPTSDQGFHCGALMAAQELGFPVRDTDIQQACAAYARMFNRQGGYFPTSVMRPEVFGGDALYGEAFTFAAFGRKSLPDVLVLQHCEHAQKIQSPYGIRVVSKSNGDFLEASQYGPDNPHALPPEKAGAYVQGGSWFFCDAGTWLSGLVHGLDPALVDHLLIRRIQAELATAPAFSESLNTRTGEHHGNVLYGANALYVWLRQTIRERLGHNGPDAVETGVEEFLRRRSNGKPRAMEQGR